MVNFILGFVIGGAVAYFFLEVFQKTDKTERSDREDTKDENIAKLKGLIEDNGGKIANDEAEKMLGVSDATAERYLNELEKQGIIKQVGKTGVKTFYEKK